MSQARIDRMIRELHAEPSLQSFQQLLGLETAAKPQAEARAPAIPVFLLKSSPAR